MTLSQLQSTIATFRKQLAFREQAALQLLAQQHAQTVQIIDARMQTLYKAVAAKEAAGEDIPVSWVLEQVRLHNIEQMISGHIDSYGAYAQQTALLLQQEGVKLGSAAAQALLGATVPSGVAFSFGMPSMDALTQFIGATKAGSPLATLFDGFGAEATQSVKQTLLTGLTLGHNPREVAVSVAQDLNVSQWRAQTIARTEMNRAYRGATLENYRANADVVEGWRWCCSLSPRTCAACLAMDGQTFSLDEELDDHPCGRCFALPLTKSWSDILGDEVDTSDLSDYNPVDDMPTGADWLANQSASVQRNILGKSGYALYSNGDATLKDFVTVAHDKTWGASIQQTSVKELGKVAQSGAKATTNAVESAWPDSLAAQDAYLKKAQSDALGSLTADEKEAINEYTYLNYRDINAGLRNPDDIAPEDQKWIPDEVAKLDAAIAKGVAPTDMTSYRGIGIDSGMLDVFQQNIGGIVSDSAFNSTTLDRSSASMFADEGGAIIHISIPKGATGLYVSPLSLHDQGEITTPEYEFLLPRDTRYKIVSYTPATDTAKAMFEFEVMP